MMTTRNIIITFLLITIDCPLVLTAHAARLQGQQETAAYEREGMEHYEAGRYKEAVETFKRWVKAQPDYAPAHNRLGVAYYALEQPSEAVKAFKQAVKLQASLVEAHYNLGNAYAALKQHDEAIESFRRAVALRPEDAKLHNSLGMGYLATGRYAEAADAFKQATKRKSDYAEAFNNLGVTYLNLKKYVEASESLKEAVRLNSNSRMAHFNLGMAYINLGDEKAALEEYKILKDLDPERAQKLGGMLNRSAKQIVKTGTLEGRVIKKPAPEYPSIAKSARASGTVIIEVVVNESGKVESAKALSGHPMLREAAVRAAYKAEFSPILLDGVPIKVSGIITYSFVLM